MNSGADREGEVSRGHGPPSVSCNGQTASKLLIPPKALQSAFDLTVDHGLQIWDALILAVTAENRCRILLTEDMQDEFTWRGVTVVNPFRVPTHPLLSSLLVSQFIPAVSF